MTEITLPAIEVEMPRMGTVVYVSPRMGVQDNKWTCMFTAEVFVNDNIEIQSFHLKCKNQKEAKDTTKKFTDHLAKDGSFPFIQTDTAR